MAYRQNFNAMQRQSAFTENADWLSKHRVTGVMTALAFEPLHRLQQNHMLATTGCVW